MLHRHNVFPVFSAYTVGKFKNDHLMKRAAHSHKIKAESCEVSTVYLSDPQMTGWQNRRCHTWRLEATAASEAACAESLSSSSAPRAVAASRARTSSAVSSSWRAACAASCERSSSAPRSSPATCNARACKVTGVNQSKTVGEAMRGRLMHKRHMVGPCTASQRNQIGCSQHVSGFQFWHEMEQQAVYTVSSSYAEPPSSGRGAHLDAVRGRHELGAVLGFVLVNLPLQLPDHSQRRLHTDTAMSLCITRQRAACLALCARFRCSNAVHACCGGLGAKCACNGSLMSSML